MRFVTTKFCIVFNFFTFFFANLSCVTIGSDSAFSRLSLVTFSTDGADDQLNGFGFFEGGVRFNDYSITCSFDSFFPVGGIVDLRAGNLCLLKDFICTEDVDLQSMGNIYGNNHFMELSKSVTAVLPYNLAGAEWLLTEVDSIYASAGIGSFDWSRDGNYIAFFNYDTMSNFYIFSFDREAEASTMEDFVEAFGGGMSVRWNPVADYVAFAKKYYFSNPGGEVSVFPYDTEADQLGTPEKINISHDIQGIAWSNNGDYLAYAPNLAGGYLQVKKFSVSTGQLGSNLTVNPQPGAVVFQDAIDWDVTGSYLAVGCVGSNPNLLIYYLEDENTLTQTASFYVYDATTICCLDWSNTSSLIAVGFNASTERLRVYEFDYGPENFGITEKTGFRIGLAETTYSVHWNSNSTKLATAIYNNFGTEFRIYSSNGSSFSLEKELEGSTTLYWCRWDFSDEYIATADQADYLRIYSYLLPDGPLPILLDSLFFKINDNLSWQVETTILGECSIDGRGNRITLEGDGAFNVAPGAQLTLKNVVLSGLSGTKLYCADETARVVLRNSELNFLGDATFANGLIYFEGESKISGTNQITYSSIMTSTINSHSKLEIEDAIFYYSPTIANRDLLSMMDKSSILHLNNCTMKSTTTGVRLTSGRLFIDNNVTFSCAGMNQSESICFGNGIVEDDLDVKILSGASIDVYGGLKYDNVG